MPITPVRGVGTVGLVKDIPSVLLPANAWSDCRNVRFDNQSVSKILGHEEMYDLTNEPLLLQYWPRPITQYYIFATQTAVSRVDSAGNVSSIGTGYSATGVWQSTLYNGGYTVIMNNTVDEPVYITYGTSGATQETTLTQLPDWPTGLSAGVVRSIGYALIAGNLTDSSGAIVQTMPGTIRISSQAAPGGLPSSWTIGPELLTTADEFELSQTSPIMEIVDLRGYSLVFTGDSIHRVQLAQAGQNTRVQNLNTGSGVLATDCAVEFDGKVFAVDRNDIYITGGSGSIQSVADAKVRDYFFSRLNGTHFANTLVRRNQSQDEMWIIYPTVDSTTGECDEALIWNYRQNTWTIRDMPNTRGVTFGPRRSGQAFVEGSEHIIFNGYDTAAMQIDTSYIFTGDRGVSFGSDEFTSFIERKTIDLGDLQTAEWLQAIYPLTTGTGTMTIKSRSTGAAGTPVDFSDNKTKSRTVDVQTDYKVEPRTNDRFLNLRFESTDDSQWTLAGYSLKTSDTKQAR